LSARVKHASPLLAALVVGIMRRSEELDISLAAKRYTVEQPLRRSVKRSMTSADYVLCGACVALFIIGAYAQF
jgi:energy-coupling factor transporter transmembrane protein EcfT